MVRNLAVLSILVGALAACTSDMPDPKGVTASGAKASDGNGVKIGDTAPTFAIDSLNGTGKLEIKPGKVTIVDFWATWCEPCKKSFPKLQELYVKHKASGLEIVAISVDDEKNGIPDFVKTHGAKFPQLSDLHRKAITAYGVLDEERNVAYRSSFVVDRDGMLRWGQAGDRLMVRDGKEILRVLNVIESHRTR